jgi:hypothetical protein
MSLIGRIRASWFRISTVMLATGAVAGCGALSGPSTAAASSSQLAMFEDGPALIKNPTQTLQTVRSLGVSTIRLNLAWTEVAPNANSRSRPGGNLADPNAGYNWSLYDSLINQIRSYGMNIDLLVGGGAPLWATQTGAPAASSQFGSFDHVWFPSASDYGNFVQAAARRYGGVINIWELWDEPNWGPALSPQFQGSTLVSARVFRQLFNAGWAALKATGHTRQTVIAGSLSQDGSASVGQTGTTAPLTFMRALYCVNSRYQPLRGNVAAAIGCPTTKAASKRFRGNNPGLFNATGVGVHPYPYAQAPNRAQFPDPNGVEFNEIPHLITLLDRVNKAYGSKKRMLAYNTEYGYQVGYVPAATAARYINWAEYLSFKNPRIATYDQFELQDPMNSFSTGLISSNGALKPSYGTYRMPIWLPRTSTKRGKPLEVWGAARPATVARRFTGQNQFVAIQLDSGSGFRTIKTVKITNGRGYIDTNVKFPASGSVRLAWQYPNQSWANNPFVASAGQFVYSMSIPIGLH